MKEDSEKMIAEHLFTSREENFVHSSFDQEMAFYESICSGNIELVRMLATPLCGEGYGVLSHDALRNIQYHLAISAALIARFCIRSGMTPEEAYHLSDVYIMKADKCGFMSPTPLTRQHSLPMSWRIMRRILVNR